MTMIRQGDVLLISTTAAPDGDEVADPRGVVLAEGGTSGHHHAVVGGGAKLFRFRDGRSDRLLEVGGAAEVRVIGGGGGGVDRHTPIALTAGRYLVRIQRAWTSGMARRVED